MAYCRNCGAELAEEIRFCPRCGQSVEAAVQNDAESIDQVDTTQKIFAALSYFGILVLIPIFLAKESTYARFHANQGLILCITGLIFGAAGSVMTVFGGLFGLLSGLLSLVIGAADIFLLVLIIMGVVNAFKGEMKELPIIGQFKILK